MEPFKLPDGEWTTVHAVVSKIGVSPSGELMIYVMLNTGEEVVAGAPQTTVRVQSEVPLDMLEGLREMGDGDAAAGVHRVLRQAADWVQRKTPKEGYYGLTLRTGAVVLSKAGPTFVEVSTGLYLQGEKVVSRVIGANVPVELLGKLRFLGRNSALVRNAYWLVKAVL